MEHSGWVLDSDRVNCGCAGLGTDRPWPDVPVHGQDHGKKRLSSPSLLAVYKSLEKVAPIINPFDCYFISSQT